MTPPPRSTAPDTADDNERKAKRNAKRNAYCRMRKQPAFC